MKEPGSNPTKPLAGICNPTLSWGSNWPLGQIKNHLLQGIYPTLYVIIRISSFQLVDLLFLFILLPCYHAGSFLEVKSLSFQWHWDRLETYERFWKDPFSSSRWSDRVMFALMWNLVGRLFKMEATRGLEWLSSFLSTGFPVYLTNWPLGSISGYRLLTLFVIGYFFLFQHVDLVTTSLALGVKSTS